MRGNKVFSTISFRELPKVSVCPLQNLESKTDYLRMLVMIVKSDEEALKYTLTEWQVAMGSQYWTFKGRKHFRQRGGQLRKLSQKLREQQPHHLRLPKLLVGGENRS